MDCKILTFGKFNSIDNINEVDISVSGCYFDWFSLDTISSETGTACERIFDYQKIQEVHSNATDNSHLQETMVLISEENTGNEMNSKVSYISMINLPMWDEKRTDKQYANIRKKIKQKILDIISSNKEHINLYHTFDHCDYVLICDGSNVSFKEYMQVLKKIRNIKVKCDNNNLDGIHDITTIYGFNLEKFRDKNNIEEEKCELNVILSLSWKNTTRKAELFAKIKKIFNNSEPVFSSEIAGRYDQMIAWKNVSSSHAVKLISLLNENRNKFFATRIHLGFDEELDHKYEVFSSKETTGLLKKAKDKFNDLSDKLKFVLKEKSLYIAMQEIHYSICTMLSRGFAQYYILSFYESFYSLLDYIVNKLDVQKLEKDLIAKEGINKNYYKDKLEREISEKIYDIYRSYFSFLNALNASTLHNDRQFLQIDSYHAMYFDAPPKLVAFYTAMANKMAQKLNASDTNNKYTFLITPDFKKDIFVDSLTEDQTIGNEQNILVIHIDEKSIYDLTSTIKIIAHEIAHHIGQSKESRKQRVEHYIKCFLAYDILSAFDDDFLIYSSEKQNEKFFKNFIDNLYNEIFQENWKKINYDNEKIGYYTRDLIDAYVAYMYEFFSKQNNDAMSKALKKTFNEIKGKKNFEKIIKIEFFGEINDSFKSKKSKEAVNDFLINKMAQILKQAYIRSLSNLSQDKYSIISYIFKECYADMRRFMLTLNLKKNGNKLWQEYFDDRDVNNSSYEDIFRIDIIFDLLSVSSDEKIKIKDYKSKYKLEQLPENKGKSMLVSFVYEYLHKAVIDYLRPMIDCEKNNEWKDETITDILKDIMSLDKKSDLTFIDRMDFEIYQYRKRLLGKS